jgi:hypothetical protein
LGDWSFDDENAVVVIRKLNGPSDR